MAEDGERAHHELLRLAREKRGFTLKQAAELLSQTANKAIHFTTIGKIETGKIRLTVDWIDLFAQAYDTTYRSLLEGESGPSGAHLVPLMMPTSSKPNRKAPYTRVVSPVGQDGMFAIPLISFKNVADMIEQMYVVIDPNQKILEDGRCYLIRAGGRDQVAQYQQSDMHFDGIGAGDRINVGTDPFEVLGSAGFVGAYLGPGN
ncbi:MAG: hypothetical protein JWO65_1920 [Sphingomonas bacterium]|nr:hypothetical protein [Sphingomonas bacterium]